MTAAQVVVVKSINAWEKLRFLTWKWLKLCFCYFFPLLFSFRGENPSESFCSDWKKTTTTVGSVRDYFVLFIACVTLFLHCSVKNYALKREILQMSIGKMVADSWVILDSWLLGSGCRTISFVCQTGLRQSYFKGKTVWNKKVSKASVTTEHSGKILQPVLKQLLSQSSSLKRNTAWRRQPASTTRGYEPNNRDAGESPPSSHHHAEPCLMTG